MQYCILTILLVSFSLSGYTQDVEVEQFELTTDTQTATFFIDIGWVGGGASMPILNLNKYRPKKLNGLDIYFDESYSDTIRNKMPSCRKGRTEIKITATIYLKEKIVGVTSNPPSSRKIYEAIVIDLIDIQVRTNPCDD